MHSFSRRTFWVHPGTDSNIFECIHDSQLKHFRCTYEYRFKLLNAFMILESNILGASIGTDSNILIAPMILNTNNFGCFKHFESIHKFQVKHSGSMHDCRCGMHPVKDFGCTMGSIWPMYGGLEVPGSMWRRMAISISWFRMDGRWYGDGRCPLPDADGRRS